MAASATVTAATTARILRSATKGKRPAWATGLHNEDEGRPTHQNDDEVPVTPAESANAPRAHAHSANAPGPPGAHMAKLSSPTQSSAGTTLDKWYTNRCAHARRGSTRIPATQVNARTATAMARLKPTNMQLQNAQDTRMLGPNSNDKPDWYSATQHMWTSWR